MSEPCFSMRLVKPFVSLLRREGGVPLEMYEVAQRADPDDRVPIAAVLRLLQGMIDVTGDRDLGLRAAREVARGDLDLMEYLAFSSRTVREGFEVVSSHIRLLNDAGSCTLRVEGPRARLVFDSSVPLPPPAVDFQLAVVQEIIRRWWRISSAFAPSVHLRHAAPRDLTQYRVVFGHDPLVFQSTFDGFEFPADLLDTPQAAADPRLHALLRRCANQELAGLRTRASFAQRVQHIQAEQLLRGRVSAESVAARLRISRRTLSRRLEDEGTGFRALLDDLRMRLATRYLVEDELSVGAVAQRLGFAEVAAFHRAFKRWYGKTPHRYRRSARTRLAPTTLGEDSGH